MWDESPFQRPNPTILAILMYYPKPKYYFQTDLIFKREYDNKVLETKIIT